MNFARQRPSRTSFAAATRVAISLTSGPSPWDVIFAFSTDATARGSSLHLVPGLWSLCTGVDSKNFACHYPLTWTKLVLCQFFLARNSSTGATTPSAIASSRGFQMTMTLLTWNQGLASNSWACHSSFLTYDSGRVVRLNQGGRLLVRICLFVFRMSACAVARTDCALSSNPRKELFSSVPLHPCAPRAHRACWLAR